MLRNYERTTALQFWSSKSIEKVKETVKSGKIMVLLASKTFRVPQAMLRRHAIGSNKTLESSS